MIHSREQVKPNKTSANPDTLNRPLQKAVQTKSIAPPDSGINFTVQKKEAGLSTEVAQLKGDPPVISNRGKKTVLLGTYHGVAGKDISHKVPGDMQQDAAVVLEYPSLAGTGKSAFDEHAIKNVNDKTQTVLARNSATHKDNHNLEVIGADGRKAFKDGEIHGLSIRHKVHGQDYSIPSQQILPRTLFSSLINKYTNLCLALSGGSVDAITNRIGNIIFYIDGTDLGHVMKSTYNRMHTLTGTLPKDRRKSIARKVVSRLDQDLSKVIGDYRGQKNEYSRNGYLQQLIEETNNNLVSAMYDALANLLLYTEVLASSKPNIIVAFGAEHLPPLQQLLGETWATARRKRRKKRR